MSKAIRLVRASLLRMKTMMVVKMRAEVMRMWVQTIKRMRMSDLDMGADMSIF